MSTMPTTAVTTQPAVSFKQLAEAMAREIARTGVVTVEGKTVRVEEVKVFEKVGKISGWTILVEGQGQYSARIVDREEATYMTVTMESPGVVTLVGLGKPSWAAIVYRD